MRFITPNVALLTYAPSIEGMYAAIEDAGRICYASKKKSEAAKEFVDGLLKKGHGRPLEFGTVYIKLSAGDVIYYSNIFKESRGVDVVDDMIHNRFTKVFKDILGNLYITTNYRVIMQGSYNTWKEAVDNNYDKNYKFFLKCWDYNEAKHYKRYYFKWGISRVTGDSFRTHCMLSTLMQSTRYCLYSSPKFGCEVTYARPVRMNGFTELQDNVSYDDIMMESLYKNMKASDVIYMASLLRAESSYKLLTNKDELDRSAKELNCLYDEVPLRAEEARGILPLDTYTIQMQCGFYDDWENFFWLRLDSHAHPDAQYIANDAYKLIQRKIKEYKGCSL